MTFDLCAIGNACIDVIADVSEDFLAARGFPKSICTYLTLAEAEDLLTALPEPVYIPGGCGANTAAVVAALGGRAGFMGRLAQDAIGAMFQKDLDDRRIAYTGRVDMRSGAGSTSIFTLMTPDAERTFAAYYGVQEDLSPDDLDPAMIGASTILYLDGYALNAHRGAETFLAAADIARKYGRLVAFSPNDLSILLKYPEAVASIMDASDIFLCNEGEALAVTGESDIGTAAAALRARFGHGAVTLGARGVLAFDRDRPVAIPCAVDSTPADLNGAGDAFTGGFLFGISHGWDALRAATLGNRCAERVITHRGARPTGDFRTLIGEPS